MLLHQTKPHTRVALVIGDGIAQGVGDSLVGGGLAPRLQTMFEAERKDARLTLPWHVFTAGRLHSRAADWAPGSESRLLEQALISGPFKRADVVAFVIGSHDDGDDEVARNAPEAIARAAEAIARLGKHVVVAYFPNFAAKGTPENARMANRACATAEALAEARERVSKESDAGTIALPVTFNKVIARSGFVVRVENSFTTFNSIGYRAFARELFEELTHSAKKVEWAHWKTKI